jgi:hypothetical protein
MMNTHPDQLFNVDIAQCTDWYRNDDFMEEIFTYVKDERMMEQLKRFILLIQERQTCTEHHPKVCYRVTDERKYVPYVQDLKEKLDAIRGRVLHKREIDANLAEMKRMWSKSECSFTDSASEFTETETLFLPTNQLDATTTHPHIFSNKSDDTSPQYHLTDLSLDVRNNILISDDKLYSDFVETLLGPVKDWIDKHRKQDWNVVRFFCRLRGIITRKCSLNIFGKFLDEIGLGNQENNMKQRKDANDNYALAHYDELKKNDRRYYSLIKDMEIMEDLLGELIKCPSA